MLGAMATSSRSPLARLMHRTVPAWLVRGLGGLMVAAGMSVPWVGEALGWWTREPASAEPGLPGPDVRDASKVDKPREEAKTDAAGTEKPGEGVKDGAGGWYTGGPASGTMFAAATKERPALVHVQGGEFVMGSRPTEEGRYDFEAQHRVRVSSFVMCETEVTQAQLKAVRGDLPEGCPGGCGDELPANNVSWFDALEYLDALSAREGLRPCYEGRKGDEVPWDVACDGYRLPTEAEWEFAARAGTVTAYSFGDDAARLGEFAWYSKNTEAIAKKVRTRSPNAWQLFDMHGNVWEWVWDSFDKNYGVDVNQVTTDPRGPSGSGGDRVLRGGSFGNGPRGLRSAFRFRDGPSVRNWLFGFRCVRAARPQP